MKFIDEFRNKEIAQGLIRRIFEVSTRPIQLMEVCGTHTVSFFRYGIREMLPQHIRLLSGPGCPVCVTPNQDIDLAIALSRRQDVVLATFGDMMRVPGSTSSLQKEKAEGRNIRKGETSEWFTPLSTPFDWQRITRKRKWFSWLWVLKPPLLPSP